MTCAWCGPVGCRMCTGRSPETLHAASYAGTAAEPFARAFGMAPGTELAELVASERAAFDAAKRRARIRELVRLVRDETNSAPLSELLDLLEGGVA